MLKNILTNKWFIWEHYSISHSKNKRRYKILPNLNQHLLFFFSFAANEHDWMKAGVEDAPFSRCPHRIEFAEDGKEVEAPPEMNDLTISKLSFHII